MGQNSQEVLDSMRPLTGDLAKEMQTLEQLFWVSRSKLKQITTRFIEELEEGLSSDGQNVPMNLTWVTCRPSGNEKGVFLTLDLGGTNLRVCKVALLGNKQHELEQDSFKLTDGMKKGSADELWDYVAESLKRFIDKRFDLGKLSEDNPLPLGFTFSYPATQERIDHGILQTWTKGLDISGVEGHDVVSQFRDAMSKRSLPVKLVALANDTTGALIASMYTDPETIIGAIFGTGCNAAYIEDCGSIPKLKSMKSAKDLRADTPMAINCEYGAFDNSHRVLPRTKYDKMIDETSPRPGEQSFEKMSAGLYLGEIFRLILVDLCTRGILFPNTNIQVKLAKLNQPYSLDTGFLSSMENDNSPNLSSTRQTFISTLDVEPSKQELVFCKRLAKCVAVRGARMTACGPAAICKKKGLRSGHVAADGSVANKHPHFKARWEDALAEILDWDEDRGEDPVTMTSAEDGSGVGVAVICALAMR
jgi:hexokinase